MQRVVVVYRTDWRRLFVLGGMLLLTISLILLSSSPARSDGYPRAMFILDASGSMWGVTGGEAKIMIAKTVLSKAVIELPPEVRVGLAAYGHRRKGDCTDIEILTPVGETDRNALLEKVSGISPKGKTPIAASIQQIADQLKAGEDETTIILVSDGEETCHPDPCGVVQSLKQTGIRFVLHVVGFDVNRQQKAELTCLSDAGGGRYFTATDTASLTEAIADVQAEVVEKVEKAKAVVKKSKTGLGKLRITIPESSLVTLAKIKIIRTKDNKQLKQIDKPRADSTHPLPAGTYRIVAGYANSNYKPDSDAVWGTYTVNGGETTEVTTGALAINMADTLAKAPIGAVMIIGSEAPDFKLTTPYTGNDYYFFKTKPLPPGIYHFAVHYKRSYLYQTPEMPVVLAKEIAINPGQASVVTIDAGIRINKPSGTAVTAWDITPSDSNDPTMRIEKATNGDYPLWATYAVAPGKYNIRMLPEGMDEPLIVGEDVTISSGDLISFDSGF